MYTHGVSISFLAIVFAVWIKILNPLGVPSCNCVSCSALSQTIYRKVSDISFGLFAEFIIEEFRHYANRDTSHGTEKCADLMSR